MPFLLTLFVVHLLALMTPGPDFLFVSKTAVSSSKRNALLAALGITLGALGWAILAVLGLHVLFERFLWLPLVIKTIGGAYLIYMGLGLLREALRRNPAGEDAPVSIPLGGSAAFRAGLLTNLANPKAAVYFGSVFATFIAGSTTALHKAAMLGLIALETAVWFSLVALVLSLPAPQRWYRRARRSIDALAGTTFAAFGLRLVLSARS